jgi:hypothetical protein
MDFKYWSFSVWTGFVWLRAGSSCGHLWPCWWNVEFPKHKVLLNSRATAVSLGTCLFHSCSYLRNWHHSLLDYYCYDTHVDTSDSERSPVKIGVMDQPLSHTFRESLNQDNYFTTAKIPAGNLPVTVRCANHCTVTSRNVFVYVFVCMCVCLCVRACWINAHTYDLCVLIV